MAYPMFEPRDLQTQPYSKDELRVVTYLHMIAPDIGAGDDPIGFLLASHNWLMRERRSQREAKRPLPGEVMAGGEKMFVRSPAPDAAAPQVPTGHHGNFEISR